MALIESNPTEAEPSGGAFAAATKVAACVAILFGLLTGGIVLQSFGAAPIGAEGDIEPSTTIPPTSVALAAAIVAPPPRSTAPENVPSSPTAVRTWTDASGKHTTEAELVDVAGGVAFLLRDGKVKAVPFIRLSKADVAFIQKTHSVETLAGKVVGVTDGDTFTLLDDSNTQHKIRLEGIDAPESTQDYGTKSRKALADRIFQQNVKVEWREKDKYGRTLGDVFVGDEWVNLKLLADGWAWHYKEYNQSAILAEAESDARMAKSGLWAGNAPVPPWDFRHPPAPIRGPPAMAAAANSVGETVYATNSGSKYHRHGCRFLSKSSIPLSLGQASGRYSPCSVCNPPTLGQTETAYVAAAAPAQHLHEVPDTTASEPTVYATRTGSKYHDAGCHHLRSSAIPMPLSEAAERYSPCSVCNPQRPDKAKGASALGRVATPSRSYAPPAPAVERRSSGEAVTGHTATGIPIHTGPRGGRYHYSKSGKKVYERKR